MANSIDNKDLVIIVKDGRVQDVYADGLLRNINLEVIDLDIQDPVALEEAEALVAESIRCLVSIY